MIYDVSLYFLLPGLMSLVSLLGVGVPEIWRVAFATAGVIGAVESVLLPIRRAPHGDARLPTRVADWLSFVVFGLLTVVAIRPTLLASAGIELRPLEVEGLLIAVLLVIGFGLAWLMFVATAEEEAARQEAGDDHDAPTVALDRRLRGGATGSRR
jgi:branched-subunit amino acid transport protein